MAPKSIPLGISNDLLWEGYGYFLEPRGVQTVKIIHKNHCFTIILKSREIKKRSRPILLEEKRELIFYRGSEKMRTSGDQGENERQQKKKLNRNTYNFSPP